MKKSLLTATALFLAIGSADAQIKLGNNPTTINADALLEIEATNKGLLLPRVALTNTTAFAPLTAHVAGMTVYNTATAGDVTPGTYYNDGTKWIKMADAAGSSINLYNADGTLTSNRTATLGSNNLTWASTGGRVILESTTASPGNLLTVINYGTNNTNGISLDKYQGTKAAPSNVQNNWNLGTLSFRGSDASGNLKQGAEIVGVAAENFSSTASGTNIDFRTTPIGTTTTSQKMRLTSEGNLGIGITNPSAKLEVAGQVKITGGSPGAGKVLTSDATGLATWATPAAGAIGTLFGAYNPIGTANLLMAAGDAEADVPGVTQTFTLTQAGTVNIIATGIVSNFNVPTVSDIQGSFKINVNGNNVTAAFASSGNRTGLSSMPTPITLSYNVVLAAGTHTIKLRYKPWAGGANLNLDAFAAPYVGSIAIDADALKSRMSILIFNN